jgi:hypothetical protein
MYDSADHYFDQCWFQVEERRVGLEKYLQLLSQDHRVVTGVSFNGFLLGAQQVSLAYEINYFN